LFTRSAVPMPSLLPNPMPQPRFGFFGSSIVLAAALMTVLKLTRSWTAGVVMAADTKMTPVTNMVTNSRWIYAQAINMPDENVASDQRGY
jgi:hypothetical protein